MKEEMGSLICRKFIATLFSGTVVTILFLYLMDISLMIDNRWIDFIAIFLGFFYVYRRYHSRIWKSRIYLC